MSDAERLYQEILANVNKFLPKIRKTHVETLSMMITGLLRGQNGQLNEIAKKVPYAKKKTSLVSRFRRFLDNERVEVGTFYNPIAEMLLESLSENRAVLAIDSSKIGGNCICLMVSVHYKSRMLPLAWTVFKGRKGHSSQETQLDLFKRVNTMVPDHYEIVLLGDGEFDGSEIVDWLEEESQERWDYVCRTDRTTKVFYQGEWVSLKDIPLEPEQEALFTQVKFTKSKQSGPTNIMAIWHEKDQCHWFFVTSFDDLEPAKEWYRFRFTIETLFSDFKGRGFHLDKTRLWKPERVDRLILVAAIAYVFTVFLGVESILTKAYEDLVRCDDCYHSLFQLGLHYLDHLLNNLLSFPDFVRLPPPNSFVHGLSSYHHFLSTLPPSTRKKKVTRCRSPELQRTVRFSPDCSGLVCFV